MGVFERISNSKFFRFLEFLYKLIILNMITFLSICLGLGIFSLMPSIVALIIVIKSLNNDEEFPIFGTYFKALFKNYKKVILIQIPYLLFFILYTFNIYYFYLMVEEYQDLFSIIAYYFSLIIFVVVLLAFFNCCFVCVYFPHLSYWKTIKYSFVLLKAITWKALVMLVLLIGVIYLSVLVVFALPIILISLYFYIFNRLISSDYNRLLPDGYSSLKATDYLRSKNKGDLNKG